MSQNNNKAFSDLPMKAKNIRPEAQCGYKIYKNREEFVVVEAEIATEAIEKSGIEKPFKVEKLGITEKNILIEGIFINN